MDPTCQHSGHKQIRLARGNNIKFDGNHGVIWYLSIPLTIHIISFYIFFTINKPVTNKCLTVRVMHGFKVSLAEIHTFIASHETRHWEAQCWCYDQDDLDRSKTSCGFNLLLPSFFSYGSWWFLSWASWTWTIPVTNHILFLNFWTHWLRKAGCTNTAFWHFGVAPPSPNFSHLDHI